MTIAKNLKSIFPGNSEMAQQMRVFDWASHEIGSPERWPEPLKTSVRIILTSRHPMFIWWGDHLINLYNDGFASFLHSKHPEAFAKPSSVVWSDIWHDILVPRIEFAKHNDCGTFDVEMPFINNRRGYPEMSYVTFSYSPLLNENHQFGGILCSVFEETGRILGQRQMALLRQLATKTFCARTRDEACSLVVDALRTDSYDIPFALIYEWSVNDNIATLEAGTGISPKALIAQKKLSLDENSIWPLKEVVTTNASILISDLKDFSSMLPKVLSQYSITQAIILPIAHSVDDRKGAIIIGISPLRVWDNFYREFMHLISAGVSSAFQNADAFEVEKRRAEGEVALRESEAQRAIELADAQQLQLISSRLIEEDNIVLLYGQILDAVMSIMGADFSSLQRLDIEHHELDLIAWKNFHPKSAEYWQKVSIHSGTSCGSALQHGERIIISDIEAAQSSIDGETLYHYKLSGIASVQSTPLTTRDGRVVGIISTHWRTSHYPTERELRLLDVLARQAADLLERHKAEEILRESEVRLRALVLSNSGVLYKMNADWSKLLSLEGSVSIADPEKNKHNWFEACIPCDEQSRVWESIQTAIHNKSIFELEHRVIQQDNKERWVFSCAVPLLNKKGQIIEWFGVARDITERKNIEQALKDTDRRKDEFLAVLAHELRNPLFPVKNALYLLLHKECNACENQELIKMMERQVTHMIRLVDDLLESSRIATGKIELHKEFINFIDVINNAIDVSKPLLDSNQHYLNLSLPSGPLMINADMVRLTQVFANLLNNSAKYTPKNGIITLNASHEDNHIVVTVQDNGLGISPVMLPKVFEMFTQDKHTTDPNNKGLGIGLAMVRSLVELHGGTVTAYSAGHNQGSEFVVSLPIEEENRKIYEKKKLIEDKKNSSPANLRVLIVDDNSDITDSFAMLLSIWEIKVFAVNDGKSALASLAEFNPHIILLDIGMPDMDGYEVAEVIRRNPQYDAIKLVALTGWNQEKDLAKSRASGFNEHLAKPVDINVLKELLYKLVEEKK